MPIEEPQDFWSDAMQPTVSGFWPRTIIASFIPTAFTTLLHIALWPRALVASAIGTAWNYHYWVEHDIQRGEKLSSAASFSRTLGFGATTPFAIVGVGLLTSTARYFGEAMVSMIKKPRLALRFLAHAGVNVSFYFATMGAYSLMMSPFMCAVAGILYVPGYRLMMLTDQHLKEEDGVEEEDDELSKWID